MIGTSQSIDNGSNNALLNSYFANTKLIICYYRTPNLQIHIRVLYVLEEVFKMALA